MKHSNEQTRHGAFAALRTLFGRAHHSVNELYWKQAIELLRREQDRNISGKYMNGGTVV